MARGRILLPFFALALVAAGALGWPSPAAAQDADGNDKLQALIQELRDQLKRGEKERLIDPWYLRDLRTPFGGVKLSGIGREGGVHSLNFYSEPTNICIKL